MGDRRDKPLLGLESLRGLRPHGNGEGSGGEILDPQTGATLSRVDPARGWRAREMLLMGLHVSEGVPGTRFAAPGLSLDEAIDQSVLRAAIEEGYLERSADRLHARRAAAARRCCLGYSREPISSPSPSLRPASAHIRLVSG